jgi:hypothetical protein
MKSGRLLGHILPETHEISFRERAVIEEKNERGRSARRNVGRKGDITAAL